MAAEAYPFPSDLDSHNDSGSEVYDGWSDVASDAGDVDDSWSDVDSDAGDDTLVGTMSSLNLRAKSIATPPRTPPLRQPRFVPPKILPANTVTQMCIVCKKRPRNVQPNGKSYPTCGLTCASKLPSQQTAGNSRSTSNTPERPARTGLPSRSSIGRPSSQRMSLDGPGSPLFGPQRVPLLVQRDKLSCVVCKVKSACVGYVTCGLSCVEKLCKDGGDPRMCDYCHRRPRLSGQKQCSGPCITKASVSCLLCKCRPRNGSYHLCGKTCNRIAMKSSPLIVEAPKGHKTFDMVEEKFQNGWKASSTPMPVIKRVFKIIESEELLRPYNDYRKRVKNEQFRYHGTGRQCQLGVTTTKLCRSKTCPICNILRTSFKISIAKTSGAFGAGVYTSSASNKAYSFCLQNGAMLLTKVVLGKIKHVKGWKEETSCPNGYDSVVFDRQKGSLNETVVYDDDAIRPVFLITF
ncbi:hypothetical protein D9611_000898 [Ephemerocybe angulata]|uniref:PARP catalytic domain-containing protein n=1 Tax=Ephemerocybe angulata TaxID=980116 RepID=A0A8H5BMC4_9AGAR|nr:hypothetical protein D9611_000898 [Tulosesus angulatus]